MPRRTGRNRTNEERQDKHQAILNAALDVFTERGFAETRLDDVAARAGVAKGTIYLYVSSKTALFEELIRSIIRSPLEGIEAEVLTLDLPIEATLRLILTRIREEVLETRRRDIAQLIISEAGRFPELAALYHRQVLSQGLHLLRAVIERAAERGEIDADGIARFPQLVIAPVLLALLWTNLFQKYEPLDVRAMLDVHVELLMNGLKRAA